MQDDINHFTHGFSFVPSGLVHMQHFLQGTLQFLQDLCKHLIKLVQPELQTMKIKRIMIIDAIYIIQKSVLFNVSIIWSRQFGQVEKFQVILQASHMLATREVLKDFDGLLFINTFILIGVILRHDQFNFHV